MEPPTSEPKPTPGPPREIRRMGRVSQEEGLSYGSYLQVPQLLALQRLLSDPPAHDELLFIVVHQAYELWFKELLFELESVREAMFTHDPERARHYLARCHAIERVLIEQIPVLESMSPQDFMEFRSNLEPASGFQSVQFREIEFLCGLKQPSYLTHLGDTDEERSRLERRMEEPTLWEAFCDLMNSYGLATDDDDVRRESLLQVARNREKYGELWYLSEALLTHDELFSLWRMRHILMVTRQIGSKSGTGGSSGTSYLRTTLDKRFFPELWELRSHL